MNFVNFSNHESVYWNEQQRAEAEKWGAIVDYPFPKVEANATEEEIAILTEEVVCNILRLKPAAVMCQGEFTLAYAVISKLKELGIEVLAACSSRQSVETYSENGNSTKNSVFKFVKFRKY